MQNAFTRGTEVQGLAPIADPPACHIAKLCQGRRTSRRDGYERDPAERYCRRRRVDSEWPAPQPARDSGEAGALRRINERLDGRLHPATPTPWAASLRTEIIGRIVHAHPPDIVAVTRCSIMAAASSRGGELGGFRIRCASSGAALASRDRHGAGQM